MATKKKSQKKKASGGSLTGMRSGMRRMAGTGSKRGKRKQQPSFGQVFTWVLGVALLLVLVWALTR